MADRINFNAPFIPVETAQPPSPSRLPAETAAAFSRTFHKAALYGAKRMNVEDQIMAGQEALAIVDAGPKEGFQPVRKPGSFWQMYNKTGLSAYAAKLETGLRNEVSALSIQHYHDPDALQKSVEKYAQGILETLPAELKQGYRQDVAVIAQPKILANHERRIKFQAESAQKAIEALGVGRTKEARALGTVVGAANLGTPEGQKSSHAAAIGYAQLLDDTIEGVYGAIQDNNLTPGEGLLIVGQQGDAMTKEMVMGMFEGTDDKEAFLNSLIAGKVLLPTMKRDVNGDPDLDKDGNAIIAYADPLKVLNEDDANSLRTYMSAQVNLIQEAEDRAIDLPNKVANNEVKGLMSALETDRSLGNLNAILDHPGATADQKREAKKTFSDLGSRDTDWEQYDMTADMIEINPMFVTRSMIVNGPFDRAAQDELLKRHDAAQKEVVEIESKPVTQNARRRVERVVGQMVSQNVQVFGGNNGKAAQERTAATALMTQKTIDVTRSMMLQGYAIGVNPGGTALEKRPDGSMVFDPDAWAKQKLDSLSERMAGGGAEFKKLRAEKRRIQAEQDRAISEGRQADSIALGDDLIELNRQMVQMKAGGSIVDLILQEEVN